MDVILAPDDCQTLGRVTLPSPKDGGPQSYLHDEEHFTLYEITQYQEEFRSWFVDNYLCQQGHIQMLTRIDPLFVFLPVMMKYATNKFRPLEDIFQEFSSNNAKAHHHQEHGKFSPLECALTPQDKPSLFWAAICETNEIDDVLYVRYSEANTLEWLIKKHDRVMDSLKVESGGDKTTTSKATLISDANDLLIDYIPASLCDKFKQAIRKRHMMMGN